MRILFVNMSKTMNIIVDHMPPYLLLLKNGSTIYDISGYVGDIWKIIENQLNVSSNYIQGGFSEGRIMLMEKTGDVLLVPIVVTTSDVQDFDFSIPVFKSWYELYAKYTVNRATSMSYLATWSPEVWMAFVLTMFVIVTCMWLVAKIRRYRKLFPKNSWLTQSVCQPSGNSLVVALENASERKPHLSR